MTEDDIKRKDWQLLTAYSNITTVAKLNTILENHAVIIGHLKGIPVESVLKQMDGFELDNYKKTLTAVKENIPDYPKIEGRNYK